MPIVYGTVRLIEQDDESFLAWAKQPYACIIFNLHVVHTPEGMERAAQAFRDLIDMGLKRGGRYYLTYHRHARRDQVEACYPQLPEFLRLKRKYDPEERFQSEWYRHYKGMFARPNLIFLSGYTGGPRDQALFAAGWRHAVGSACRQRPSSAQAEHNATAGKPGGYVLERDKDVAKNEPGTHNGGGETIGYSFFARPRT